MARKRTITSGAIAVAVAAVLWLFLAPVQLGGSVVYTATVGNSMAPRFHKGDLALVRPTSNYSAGDVVLYESPVLRRAVLHRILVVQNGHYFFKGDNNSFVDPGYATRGELLGKLWFRVPAAGKAFGWIGKPAHAALVCAGAVFFLLFGAVGGKATRRRKAQPRQQRRAGVLAFVRHGLRRPRRTPALYVGSLALLLAIVLVPLAFLSPLRKTIALSGAFRNEGTFAYSAVVKHSAVYPDGILRTGQPIFLSAADRTTISFAYRFRSGLPHTVRGTLALRAQIAGGGWQHTYVIHKRVRFVGDGAAVHMTVSVRSLQALAQQLAIQSGVVGVSYDVTLEPVVHVTGIAGGKPVDSFFAPTLPFTLSGAALTPNPPQAETLPGADYQAPSAKSALAAAIHPVVAGSIPVYAPNYLTIARYKLADSTGRGLGLGLLVLGILLCLAGQFRRRRDLWSNEQRIAFRYECAIIDVASLPATGYVVEMTDFEQLAALAHHLDRPILHERHGSGDLYAVDDVARRYCVRAAATLFPADAEQPKEELPLVAPPARRTAGGRAVALRASGLVVVLAITIAAATAFTAGNTVPPTRAGTSNQASALSQLVPTLCASQGVTTVVSPSGNFNGAPTAELILGPNASGPITLNGGGGNDCIVAGGGSTTDNTLDGGPGTNVCIGSPTAHKNTFKNCQTTG